MLVCSQPPSHSASPAIADFNDTFEALKIRLRIVSETVTFFAKIFTGHTKLPTLLIIEKFKYFIIANEQSLLKR